MNSKERVLTSFFHRTPDRVPLFDLSIDSRPAAALMGRYMWIGDQGSEDARANRMF